MTDFEKRDAIKKDVEALRTILDNAFTEQALSDAFIDAEITAISVLNILFDGDRKAIQDAMKEFYTTR